MATVTLTCTVVLDSSVDVPVTVNTVWIGPDNFNRNIMAQQMGNTTTYTSTVMVSSFGRDQSGDYTCTATVSSTSPFITGSMSSSPLTRVTVGKECVSGLVNPRRAHALARVTVVGLSVVCLCVCLSGLNLLLHASRATRYYTYVYFTMNARFNMCGVR